MCGKITCLARGWPGGGADGCGLQKEKWDLVGGVCGCAFQHAYVPLRVCIGTMDGALLCQDEGFYGLRRLEEATKKKKRRTW